MSFHFWGEDRIFTRKKRTTADLSGKGKTASAEGKEAARNTAGERCALLSPYRKVRTAKAQKKKLLARISRSGLRAQSCSGEQLKRNERNPDISFHIKGHQQPPPPRRGRGWTDRTSWEPRPLLSSQFIRERLHQQQTYIMRGKGGV